MTFWIALGLIVWVAGILWTLGIAFALVWYLRSGSRALANLMVWQNASAQRGSKARYSGVRRVRLFT
jgi:hypothetical protein